MMQKTDKSKTRGREDKRQTAIPRSKLGCPVHDANGYVLRKPLLEKKIFSLHTCVCANSLQSCPTLCNTMDRRLPGFFVHGGFSRQEHWSGLSCPPPGDLPDPGLNPGLPYCRQVLYHLSHQGSTNLEFLKPSFCQFIFPYCPRLLENSWL